LIRIGRGTWRGQVLRPDLKGVRPTSSRVREALMSILADRLSGAVVWDLFSGSGAFGIECVSCGAKKALFMDSSPVNLNRISKFFKERNSGGRCITVKGKLPEESGKLVRPVDIVFLDPPFKESDIYSWILEFPWDSVVKKGGVVIAESGGHSFDSRWKTRKYGEDQCCGSESLHPGSSQFTSRRRQRHLNASSSLAPDLVRRSWHDVPGDRSEDESQLELPPYPCVYCRKVRMP